MRNLMILCLALVSFAACKKEVNWTAVDRDKIEQYLTDNNLDAQAHSSGLYYILRQPEGTGSHPKLYDNVTVKYKGYLLDGTIFDQTSADRPIFKTDLIPGGLIDGWLIAIPLLKEGGKGTFLIPSGLAYGGRSPSPLIPPNTVLLFDIELLSIN